MPARWILLLLVFSFRIEGATPEKLAGSARFDLTAAENISALNDGSIVSGSGSVGRKTWDPNPARGFTVNFSITHFAPKSIEMRFVPATDGTVTLSLMGPFEEVAKGELFREEVLWKEVTVRGAEAGPELSTVPGAKSWHNQPLFIPLRVTAGKPVTILARAQAELPPGFKDMRRIAGTSSPAHRAIQRFRHGANLGNYLEAPPNQNWGARYSEEDFRAMAREGFDHARIPVAWSHYTGPGPDFPLAPDVFAKTDFLVTNALANHLAVIVNIHHFDDFTSNPSAQTERFYAIWRQLGEHYAHFPETVAFELINEPKDAATTTMLGPIYAQVIREIRKTNPRRTIFLGPGRWNSIDELGALRLPDDDDNLIVTVHCYEPFYFTHQGASWSGPDTRVTGIKFPGPPATPLRPDPSVSLRPGVSNWIYRYNTEPPDRNPSSPRAFRDKLDFAREWSVYYGRPIHVGEFGCYVRADAASRANFYREFRAACDELGIGWAVWDWKAGFKYWDDQSQKPAPGMRQALFGKP